MIKYSTRFLLLLLIIVSFADINAASNKRSGTAAAPELTIPVGARGMALNGANITGIKGIDAIFYNPAGMGATSYTTEAHFSQMQYIADIGISYAAVAVNMTGMGSLGFHIKSMNFGDIPVTTVDAPQGTGATFSPTYVTVGATYANALTDRIRVGVNFKYVTEKIMRVSTNVFAIDAGVQYNNLAGIDGLQIGVVLKNLGPQSSFTGPDLLRKATDPTSLRGEQYYAIDAETYELPSQLELGLGYETKFQQDFGANVSYSFSNNNFDNDLHRLGAELSYKEMFFVRGGYRYVPNKEEDYQDIYGPSFGAGFVLRAGVDITVDYAYQTLKYFDALQMFSVKLGF